jgi:hypothetical protein
MSPQAARVLLLGALLAVVSARAQTTSVSGALGDNNGIRFGPGRLHPYFDLEGRYDSAAIYLPTTDPNIYELKPEILMHFRPGFRLDVPGTDVTFGLNGFYDYVWYTEIITSGSNAASRSEAGADMHAEINREGAVEFDVADIFARSDRPRDIGIGVAVISLYNQLKLTAPIHPGGRAFEVRPHGAYTVEFFGAYSGIPQGIGPCPPGTCPTVPSDPSVNDYQNYAAGADVHWKFLPQTALVFESNFEGRSYFHPDASVVPPGKILKLLAGAQGLVTPKIQAILKAGYAIGFDGRPRPSSARGDDLDPERDHRAHAGRAPRREQRGGRGQRHGPAGVPENQDLPHRPARSARQLRLRSHRLHPGARPERSAVQPGPRSGLRDRPLVHHRGRLRVLQADVGL